MKKSYKVEVDCASCAAQIENAICKIDGIEDAVVNFMTQKMTLTADASRMKELAEKAEKAGKKIDSDFEVQF